jgi:hypothetical protein
MNQQIRGAFAATRTAQCARTPRRDTWTTCGSAYR